MYVVVLIHLYVLILFIIYLLAWMASNAAKNGTDTAHTITVTSLAHLILAIGEIKKASSDTKL